MTSAALQPSPSASSARGPSVKITRRGRWCPLPWKAGSAARSTTLRPPCPPSTGARSSVNWNHRITEKKSKSKRAAKCPSFYLKGKKGEEKSRGRISARRDRCDAGSLGQQRRLSKAGAGSQSAGRSRWWALLFSVPSVWEFLCGGLDSLGLFLPFYCAPEPLQLGKKSCLRFLK